MSINPDHVIAMNEVLREMWGRQVGSFSIVPAEGGFSVVADGDVVFESKRCDYQKLDDHYVGSIKLYSPYWRNNPPELPNQKYMWAFRLMSPPRFLDVFVQKGERRIDFTFYVPLGTE